MKKIYKLNLPLSVKIGKKIRRLNLNYYRNWHYHILNLSKKEYKRLIYKDILPLPTFKKIELDFYLYPERKADLSNICSIVDKYTTDVLVQLGKIEDDNFNYIDRVGYHYVEIDKKNPRVCLHIKGEVNE